MNGYLYFFLFGLIFGLTACQSTPIKPYEDATTLSNAKKCCSEFSELSYQKLDLDDEKVLELTTQDPIVELDGKRSYVKSYSLSNLSKPLELLISTSQIPVRQAGINALIRPVIFILDDNYHVTRVVRTSRHKHWYSNHFQLTIFFNENNQSEQYFIIGSEHSITDGIAVTSYSTAQYGVGLLTVPVTLSTNNKNIKYVYSPTGRISIELKAYAPNSIKVKSENN